ncbi:hypothetical protein LA66_11060 [Aureimonas altamirensis]|uniref:Uncharacterized protein n=1 Tax=Aureimonas altamirensis TaxID=370622 RepID=A0A0B1Q3U9_9HYPH|nr:hypothetical protein [Aureimonas altamirensis]KHJ55064.1 hypothetical protein LA66_11060 [Aureimonas altamirensis]
MYSFRFVISLIILLSATTVTAQTVSIEDYNALRDAALARDARISELNERLGNFRHLQDEAVASYMDAYYKHHTNNFSIIENAYKAQKTAGDIILAIVAVIILSSLYMSYIQLRHGFSLDYAKIQADKDITSDEKTRLLISSNRMAIQTSFVGLAILVVSVTFFFIYITYVYPISRRSNDPVSGKSIWYSHVPVSASQTSNGMSTDNQGTQRSNQPQTNPEN